MSAPPDDASQPVSPGTPVLGSGWGYASIGDKIAGVVVARPFGRVWFFAFLASGLGTLVFFAAIVYLFVKGVGIWGINEPVAWGFAIANYVWWIGIGMSGTFISAALLLTRQPWRASINRFAEAMTLFAVSVSGLFPIIHLGRPWFFYWLVPYPNVMNVWPQWRSPLVWDFFAIVAYLGVSILFFYVGLLPDLATLRDRVAAGWKRVAYGLLALGWRGEARHWARHKSVYLLLAGLATPLVFSVHSVVGLDFAIGNTPGWHSTLFPPFFVAGALLSGFAMVLTIAIPLRHFFDLRDIVTDRHLQNAAKVLLAVGCIVAYSYATEVFTAFYSGDRYEVTVALERFSGPYAFVYWTMLACNVAIPQLLWFRRVRHSVWALFALSLVVQLGMWLERVMLVVSSLANGFMPSAWGLFVPTLWDWTFLFGSISLFVFLFLLFVRVLPSISIAETRGLVRATAEGEGR